MIMIDSSSLDARAFRKLEFLNDITLKIQTYFQKIYLDTFNLC